MDARLLRNEFAHTTSRDTSPAMWLAMVLWLFYATGGQTDNRWSMMEQAMTEGPGPPAHTHPMAIEGFYVLEGSIDFSAGGETVAAGAGTLVHLPRLIEHTFTVKESGTRVLNFYAPAGLELQILALGRPADERRRPTMEEGPPPNGPELNQALSAIYGTEGVTDLPFNVPPSEENMVTSATWNVGPLCVATAEHAPCFTAFGMTWRQLASGTDTDGNYDMFDVEVPDGAAMPSRIVNTDEALYVLEGDLVVETDGEQTRVGEGSFTFAKAGGVLGWHADGGARVLVFHFPGGFDRILARADGDDDLVVAGLEAAGSRVLDASTRAS